MGLDVASGFLAGRHDSASALAKDSRFTLAVVITLGLGIGVNNSVFTIVNTALIREVPFEEPDRLLAIGLQNRDGREVGLSYPEYRDWAAAKSLEGIGVSIDATMNLSEDGLAPERLRGTYSFNRPVRAPPVEAFPGAPLRPKRRSTGRRSSSSSDSTSGGTDTGPTPRSSADPSGSTMSRRRLSA